MRKKGNINKERENWLAKYTYRKIANPLAIFLSKFNITSVQISIVGILTSIIACLFFSWGNLKSLIIGYVFLQLTILLDHVDGAIARYTDNKTLVGSWFDKFSNKLHRFFFTLGVSIGVYRITNEPLYLILGNIAGFLWCFSIYISETKRLLFKFKEDITLFKESKYKTFFPFTLLVMNLFGFLVLINQSILALWFVAIISLNAFQQIYSVRKLWYKEK